MNRNLTTIVSRLAAGAGALLFALPGHAAALQAPGVATASQPASAVAPASASTDSDTLALARARIPLLQAEREITALEKEIAQNRQAADDAKRPKLLGGAGGPTAAGIPMGELPPVARRSADVALVGVGSYDGRNTATLVINNVTHDVKVGDALENGWTVARIARDGVQLAQGRQTRWVKF
ncbi:MULTISPECIES: hypothetical protein [Burkholderia cepacia complex]|uniref:hypothetical protein n=1 Tax=Burkholderia cepacia complex TaxID=87882 RepID=UPI00158DA9F4|nr:MULTISPECIES: hypothetical protein [Burkholderia cepacia complex]MBR8426437.1 hypothetical protein [Burkholderia cenocepacia]MBR8494741.1 hypothetical protein [Burkholderia cenocepacia]MCA8081337.1 hypothetical protein [Burkholderia cepacia]